MSDAPERSDEIRVFETQVAGLGTFALRRLRLPEDAVLIHDWVGRPYARFWNMGDRTRAEIATFYAEQAASDHEEPLIGMHDGAPAFLVETYDPACHELADHYTVRRGDRGMHVLVGPASAPLPGFTRAVFRTIMEHLFADPDTLRVVVEPDVRNAKIHALNERFGFVRERDVILRDKVAALSFCSRAQFLAAVGEPA